MPSHRKIVAIFLSYFDVLDAVTIELQLCTLSTLFRMLRDLCSCRLITWVWPVTILKHRTSFVFDSLITHRGERLISHFWVVSPVMYKVLLWLGFELFYRFYLLYDFICIMKWIIFSKIFFAFCDQGQCVSKVSLRDERVYFFLSWRNPFWSISDVYQFDFVDSWCGADGGSACYACFCCGFWKFSQTHWATWRLWCWRFLLFQLLKL